VAKVLSRGVFERCTVVRSELPRRLGYGILSGISLPNGVVFLWILSFVETKESSSPQAKAFLLSSEGIVNAIHQKMQVSLTKTAWALMIFI